MAIKKSELYSSIWKSCDELRGGMDASQYKDYVLVLLFAKYVSDKYAGQPRALIEVPEGGSFKDMVKLKGDKEIGDKINKIIGKLAEANGLKGVIDIADFNDEDKLGRGKEMVDRLSNLIAIFENPDLDFSKNRVEGDDILGDAYEFLMRHFATESGKSKGQFYTPAEVSRVIAKVIGIHGSKNQEQTIYDPTCGSGSLLLKAADEVPDGVTIYGQEKDIATTALARMNMILHDNPTADIASGGHSTLSDPQFRNGDKLKTFDYVIANPPFSYKSWMNGFNPTSDPYERFTGFGIPPKVYGDYAFLLHIVKSLKSTGKGACILPHGVLFRGGAEGEIRKNLIKRGYIKGIIGLPPNLFYGTSIPACIIVLDKEHAMGRTGIFMIDASKGLIKDGNKNRLRAQDIHRIVDTFTRQIGEIGYSRMVPTEEITDPKNDYNLNLPRYIDSSEPEDLQDIEGHLRGGVPVRDLDSLVKYWEVLPSVRHILFESAGRPCFSQLKIPIEQVKQTIFEHPEFRAFNATITKVYGKWKEKNQQLLTGIKKGGRPKELIHTLSEDLLRAFRAAKLIDAYDVYQLLMDYWGLTMQDDAYLIAQAGWIDAAKPRQNSDSKEQPDFTIGKQRFRSDLIPARLLITQYFPAERGAIDAIERDLAEIGQQLEEQMEEQGGEDGLLEEVIEGDSDKRKITSKDVRARVKEIGMDPDFAEELKALEAYLNLLERQSDARNRLKKAQVDLNNKLAAKYSELTEDEVKTLVVDDKWLASLAASIQIELERVSQTLSGRIFQLAKRYATPLPDITAEVVQLAACVDGHLKKMGTTWN